ncbi:MAG: M23 family metallopeptidase [Cryomorphaceae bacterium]|nr:M23 family metallopeptidase [Cryomorphaceae bacterium]
MKFKTIFIYILLTFSLSVLGQQNYPKNYFQSPLDIPLFLSGTFGELRSNHFHAGIDIKTQASEGKRVLAAADGYVSRINVSTRGYGKAIYITHPNGLMTVYAHLQRFNEEIESFVRQHQKSRESFEVSLYPEAGKLPVKQGDVIAVSGNTGGSGGPHLHFEVRDQGGERPINPLQFNFDISDTQSPKLFRLKVYEIGPAGNIRGEKEIPIALDRDGIYKPGVRGKIVIHNSFAVGVQGYDHQNGSQNKNGIYRVAVVHEDSAYYSFQADGIRFDQSKYINAFIDYPEKINEGKTFYRLYEPPHYKLDAHPEKHNRGIIHVEKNGDYTITLEAKDFHGNKSTVKIPVEISCKDYEGDGLEGNIWNYNMSNAVSDQGIRASLAAYGLYENHAVDYAISPPCAGCIAPQFTIGSPDIPIHSSLMVAFERERIDNNYPRQQMVMVRHNGDGKWSSIGADDNSPIQLMSYSKSFGTFSIKVDSISPRITNLNFLDNQTFDKAKVIQVHVSDDFSGIDKYRATINGKWILMEYEPKRSMLFFTFDDTFSAGENVLHVTAWDVCGNKTEKTWTIIKN